MKKILTLCMAVAISIPLVAQDLTKEETVSYINKKVKECEGRTRKPAGDLPLMHHLALSFYLNSDGTVTHYIKSSNYAQLVAEEDYFVRDNYYTFNPAHIVSIAELPNDNNKIIGSFIIKLKGQTGKGEQRAQRFLIRADMLNKTPRDWKEAAWTQSMSEIQLLYLKTDDTNFSKIKKALEYLRDLCKAEEEFDPFG